MSIRTALGRLERDKAPRILNLRHLLRYSLNIRRGSRLNPISLKTAPGTVEESSILPKDRRLLCGETKE